MTVPSDIRLRRRTAVLELEYEDGTHYQLPAELLRVHAPSADVQGHGDSAGELVSGKRHVSIDDMKPVGHYAIQLFFSDGHRSGIYNWAYLRSLGENQQQLWQDYLERLKDSGKNREDDTVELRNAVQVINIVDPQNRDQ